jgi:molecular chaperone DnaK (HSP70)
VNSAAAEKYASMFPEHKLEAHPTRDTVVFRIDEETSYTVEELVAMILQHVVELGSEYAGETREQ